MVACFKYDVNENVCNRDCYICSLLYIHNIIGHYKPLVRLTIRLPIPLLLSVLILYMSDRIYNLKSIPNDRFFLRNFSWQFCLFTRRVFARNLLRWSCQRNIFFFIFSFWCLTWGLNRGLISNKLTHYILDCGNYFQHFFFFSYFFISSIVYFIDHIRLKLISLFYINKETKLKSAESCLIFLTLSSVTPTNLVNNITVITYFFIIL